MVGGLFLEERGEGKAFLLARQITQPGRPTLRALVELVEVALSFTSRRREVGGCFLAGQGQLGGAQLAELPPHPQPPQGKGRAHVRGNDEVRRRGQVLQQPDHDGVGLGRGDALVLIEDEGEGTGGREEVEERGEGGGGAPPPAASSSRTREATRGG
jgi:hypothetical protein